MRSLPEVYGIILAAGQSKRMGCNKLLLPYQGRPLVEHVLKQTVQADLTGVYVTVSNNDIKLQQILSGYACQAVLVDESERGMGHSLATAVKFLPSTAKAVIVLQADQPGIQVSDLQYIQNLFVGGFIHGKAKVPTIILTKYLEGEDGHPVLFSKHFFPQLSQLRGDVGGKEIIRSNQSHVQFHMSSYPFPQDIDTPADYSNLQSTLRRI